MTSRTTLGWFFAVGLTTLVAASASGCGGGDSGDAAGGSPSEAGGAGGAGAGGSSSGQGGTAGSGGMSGHAGGGAAGASGAGHAGSAGTAGAPGGAGGTSGTGGASGHAGGGASGQGGSTGGASGAGNAGVSGAAGAAGGSSGAAGAGGGACNASEVADANAGIFVATTGSDTTGDGTLQKPYASIAQAILKAANATSPIIYLAPGTYTGTVHLPDVGATLDGSWVVSTTSWTRDCAQDAVSKTTITSNEYDSAVVHAVGLTMQTRLHALTVKTKDQGASMADQSGESVIGILASKGTQLTLDGVDVIAGIAGDGGTASPAPSGGTKQCDGTDDCSTGAKGEDGTDGAAPASYGTFGESGYSAGDGTGPNPGTAGENGSAAPGQTQQFCVVCDGTSMSNCPPASLHTVNVSGTPGTCGCAATPGTAGFPGRGGGASVGVLIVDATTSVSVSTGSIASSGAGSGTSGSASGDPGLPTTGSSGQGALCEEQTAQTVCGWNPGMNACVPDMAQQVAAAGGVGTTGGAAGKGGKGGPGAGGPSFAVVKVGGPSFLAGTAMLSHGNAGKGADGAPDGDAGDIDEVN